MSKSLCLTTTVPYVNAAPHIGFALELVQADVVARFERQRGTAVRFQTGTDENAFKNVSAARARGIPVQQLVDENAARFQSLGSLLDISADTFVRTTSAVHRNAVASFLSRLNPDDLYGRRYEGLYCRGCEDFYLERDLDAGRCPDHGVFPTTVAEENVFFRLSRYQSALRDLITSRRLRIVPESRAVEVLRFVDQGLVDISISRDAVRSEHWGIPFPGDASQVVYVWIDALVNYLTGVGYPDGDTARYWTEATKVHLIGKNVWKFHAVYWPALLLSAGLRVPDQIVVHGFLTNDGKKISKSSGDAVDPAEYVKRVGTDGVRYFLLRHVRPFDDSDFSLPRLEAAYEADLVNGLGNLLSRVTALCEAACVPGVSEQANWELPEDFRELLSEYQFDLALASIWSQITRINRELAETKPWADVRHGHLDAAREKLSPLVKRLASISYWLAPFLPATSGVIQEQLSRTIIRKAPALFSRLIA
jgi:methionyl-tRNA synthetase